MRDCLSDAERTVTGPSKPESARTWAPPEHAAFSTAAATATPDCAGALDRLVGNSVGLNPPGLRFAPPRS